MHNINKFKACSSQHNVRVFNLFAPSPLSESAVATTHDNVTATDLSKELENNNLQKNPPDQQLELSSLMLVKICKVALQEQMSSFKSQTQLLHSHEKIIIIIITVIMTINFHGFGVADGTGLVKEIKCITESQREVTQNEDLTRQP